MRDTYTFEFPLSGVVPSSREKTCHLRWQARAHALLRPTHPPTARINSARCALMYILAVSLAHSLPALLTASILPLALIITHRLTLSHFIRLNVINSIMIITLALTWPGFRDGLTMGLVIALRINMIAVAFTSLVMPLGISAAYSFPLPQKLRVLLLLTMRGIFTLRDNLNTALTSVKLRAPKLHGLLKLKVYAYIVGGVLLKSSLKSDRMMNAITNRGGFSGFNQYQPQPLTLTDKLIIMLGVLYASAILVMNYA